MEAISEVSADIASPDLDPTLDPVVGIAARSAVLPELSHAIPPSGQVSQVSSNSINTCAAVAVGTW